jgi:hypothetical protein
MKRVMSFLLIGVLTLGSAANVDAQCAMCKRNVETNKETRENKVGTGLNKGILYLMSVPYLIGAIGLAMWMKRKKES